MGGHPAFKIRASAKIFRGPACREEQGRVGELRGRLVAWFKGLVWQELKKGLKGIYFATGDIYNMEGLWRAQIVEYECSLAVRMLVTVGYRVGNRHRKRKRTHVFS